jgi:acetyl-CoA C-acetyltransferase/acetyl-CoA acyltransferase
MSQPSIVIAAGLRTAQARAGGRLRGEDAGHLGAEVARELLARSALPPGEIDEVVVGCAGPPHDQANVARVIALRAGVPEPVPAYTVARNCASGMEAVTSAVTSIRAGRGDTYLCLGVEVMSSYPMMFGRKMTALFERLSKARSLGARLAAMASFRPSFLAPRIGRMEGLTDPISGLIMGKTAELLARDFDIGREASDVYAVESHRRAQAARDAGRFAREILPVVPLGPKETSALEHDDGIRDGQTLEGMAKLKPFFEKPDGVVTVGNACGITDAACALLITTEDRARALGLSPLARIKDFAWAGLDPARMGLGPVFSTAKLCDATGVRLADIGTIELNEAFAVQVLACAKAFESDAFAREKLGRDRALGTLDLARTNPNGGAIALGHPVGATGARILLTAAHELVAGDHELALATLCIGGGQGGAVLLERCAA